MLVGTSRKLFNSASNCFEVMGTLDMSGRRVRGCGDLGREKWPHSFDLQQFASNPYNRTLLNSCFAYGFHD